MFVYASDGFTVTNGDFEKTIRWEEIDRINAYKKDLVAYDLIVLEIVCGDYVLTLDEVSPGWFSFILKLKDVFKTIPKDWDINIIQPPFKENYTILFKKE